MTGHDRYEANYVAFNEVAGWPTTASNSVGHMTPCATEDLKLGKFTHADAGQMNLYLNYAREHWTHPHENPPIGLILSSENDTAVAHYALDNLKNRVLARQYQLTLPTVAEIAARIDAARRLIAAPSALPGPAASA